MAQTCNLIAQSYALSAQTCKLITQSYVLSAQTCNLIAQSYKMEKWAVFDKISNYEGNTYKNRKPALFRTGSFFKMIYGN
jgi:hypothetical protein